MDKSEFSRPRKEARNNHITLESCTCHDFSVDLTPEREILKRWQCTQCQGEIDRNQNIGTKKD